MTCAHLAPPTFALEILCLALAGCGGSTEPDSGAFDMTASVSDIPWSAGGEGTTPPTAFLYRGDHTLLVSGTQSGVSPATRGIGLEARNVVEPGTYELADLSATVGSATYSESNGSIFNGDFTLDVFTTSAAHPGTLVVTAIDTVRHTISGIFAFEAADATRGVLHIGSGSFEGHLDLVSGTLP
jgi:hypothetical protein